MTRIGVRAFTDVGLRRKRNEDAVLVAGWVCQTHEGSLATMDFEPTFPFVCAVADGMGGHAGGNVASRLALTVIAERSTQWCSVQDIAATIGYANDQVRGVGAETQFEGLGTTVAGLCITRDAIIVFNVGDSRAYAITGGQPQQLSHDDSVLDVDGNPTNVITQSLGQAGHLQTHVTTLPLQQGTYLLCSDGVSGMLTEADMRAAVMPADLLECAANIIRTTRANGAEDNFSFVIVDVPDFDSPDTQPVASEAVAPPPVAPPPVAPPPGGAPPGGRPAPMRPPVGPPRRMPSRPRVRRPPPPGGGYGR